MNNARSILVIALAALLLLPGLAFITLRLTIPTDTGLPVVDFNGLSQDGLVIQPISPNPGGLQSGDIVTAIEGKPLDQYIASIFSTSSSNLQPGGSAGQIEYKVLRNGHTLQVSVPLKPYPLIEIIQQYWSMYVYILYLLVVSLMVFLIRPGLPAARLFFIVSCVVFSCVLAYFPGLEIDDLFVPWLVILFVLGAVVQFGLMLALLVHNALIFPRDHPVLNRIRGWKLWIYLGVWVPMAIYLFPRWGVASPVERLNLLVQGTNYISLVFFPLVLLASYSSYRFRNAREKRQMRWVVWALVIALVPYLIFSVLPSLLGLNEQIPTSVWGLLWCVVPTAFAIAVLRERLFDIDVIIRRTLVYSTLTVALAGVYFVSVVLLQGFFQVLTGQYQSPLATVLSTLVIAALFTPMRRRIQNVIDKRFFRRKYDAEKMLKTFSLSVRNEVELDRLSEHMLEVVEETLEPQSMSLWIKET